MVASPAAAAKDASWQFFIVRVMKIVSRLGVKALRFF